MRYTPSLLALLASLFVSSAHGLSNPGRCARSVVTQIRAGESIREIIRLPSRRALEQGAVYLESRDRIPKIFPSTPSDFNSAFAARSRLEVETLMGFDTEGLLELWRRYPFILAIDLTEAAWAEADSTQLARFHEFVRTAASRGRRVLVYDPRRRWE